MTIPLRDLTRRLGTLITDAAKALINRCQDTLGALGQRHCDLMADTPTYRGEIIAAAGAIRALIDAPTAIVTAVIAILGLYVAAYGTQPHSSSPARTRDWDDEPTNPRLWDIHDWK